jgi:hypothetical protein
MSIGQKQRVVSLRFFLFDRPLHPELFDIYDDRHISRSAYEAQVWVTGCTHVIGFYRRGQSLVEVVCDMEQGLPSRGKLLELPFKGEKDHKCRKADGINYMMNFQLDRMNPAVYSRTHHELARQGSRRGLFVPFPSWMANKLTPFTFIDFDARPNELHVFAFHAFPEDLTIIKTQSIFEVG